MRTRAAGELAVRLLEAGLDIDAAADEVAATTARALGSAAAFVVLFGDGHCFDTRAIHYPDPDTEQLLAEFLSVARPVMTDGLLRLVGDTREPLLLPTVPSELFSSLYAQTEYVPVLDRVPVHSLILCPLVAGDQVLGELCALRVVPDHPFDQVDVNLVASLARPAAQVLAQARVLEEATRENARLCGAEADLRRRAEQLEMALDAGQLAVWDWDLDSGEITWSGSLAESWGIDPGALRGPVDALRGMTDPMDRESVDASISAALVSSETHESIHRVNLPDGGTRWIETKARVVRGDDGEARGMTGIACDITEQKLAVDELTYLATHDLMTGLMNRARFGEVASESVPHGSGAILFLDLDDFKQVNDAHGHSVGDKALAIVARRIASAVRDHDVVARWGGDEFVVLLDELPEGAAEASAVGWRIVRSLRAPFMLNGCAVSVSASIGMALYPDDGGDLDTLVRSADAAMYLVKHGGGSGCLRAFRAPSEPGPAVA